MKDLIGMRSEILAAKVALFSQILRVTGCGLFFASVIAVKRSRFKNLREL